MSVCRLGEENKSKTIYKKIILKIKPIYIRFLFIYSSYKNIGAFKKEFYVFNILYNATSKVDTTINSQPIFKLMNNQ